MGIQCSKCQCEQKEMVVNQHGIEQSTSADLTTHFYVNNILVSTIIGLCVVAILIIAYKNYKKCHANMIQGEINNSALRRMQMRWSGRRTGNQDRDGSPNPA